MFFVHNIYISVTFANFFTPDSVWQINSFVVIILIFQKILCIKQPFISTHLLIWSTVNSCLWDGLQPAPKLKAGSMALASRTSLRL